MAAVIRKRANPAPLGMAGYGLTTVLLGLVFAGALPFVPGESVVVPATIFFGGLAQVLAGLLEAREGNTFGTTVFTSFGCFNIWFGSMVVLGDVGALNTKGNETALGVWLLLWAWLTWGFWIATFRLTRVVTMAVFVAAITFTLLGLGNLIGSHAITIAGAWAAVITGALATYGSSATLINTELGRTVLPVGERPQVASDEMLLSSTLEVRQTPG
ncbi:MAG: acetate uptake transporter [Steroidobacteraceae bacterium]